MKWDKYIDSVGNFDHFNIYRALSAPSSTNGLQPIVTINSVSSTTYLDNNFPPAGCIIIM